MRTFRHICIMIMLLVFGFSFLMAQTTVTIYSSADNSPDEFYPTTNRGACDRVYITGGTGSRGRGLFKFDLSSIPAGATITSGTLYLYRILGTGSGNVNVHRVTNDWTEGTASCTGTVGMVSNWNQRAVGATWSSAGGDYHATVEATSYIQSSTYTTYSWNIQNLIQGWVNGAYTNYGLLIKQADESEYNQMTFATREYTGTANDARLVITYTSSSIKTWTGNVSADWGTAGNWSPLGVPSFGDTALVPTNPSGGRFPICSGENYYLEILNIQPGATVTQSDGYLILYDIIIRGGSPGAALIQNGGSLYIHRDWINNGTFTSNSGIVLFDGTGTSNSDFTGINQFSDLFVQDNPKFDNKPASIISIRGTFTSNSSIFNPSSNATFLFNGSGDQNITKSINGDKARFGNIEIDKISGSVFLKTNVDVSGNVTINNGTLDTETNLLQRNIPGGSFSLNNNSIFKIGGINGMPTSFTTRTFSSISTVEYSGTNQNVSAENYGNLTLSGSGTKTFANGTTGIAGSFSVNGNITPLSAISKLPGGTANLIDGTFASGNIFINTLSNNSNINYNGSFEQIVLAIDYYDLSLSNAGTKYLGAGTVGIFRELYVNDSAVVNAILFNDTIKYFGTDQNVRYGFVNKNLRIEGQSSITALTNIHIINSLVIGTTASLNMNNNILTVDGRLINNGIYVSTNPAGSLSFYSKSSGDYNSLGSWSNSGYTGAAPVRLPGMVNNDVLIIGNNKTINLTSNLSNLGTVRVESTGTLNPAAYIISGIGEFDLRAGGNLIISLPNGLNSNSGNIQTEIQMFNGFANYEFRSNVPQVTGASFPSSAGNLIINNPSDVTLSGNIQLNGNLSLIQGRLILENNILTLRHGSSILGTPSSSSMIVTNGTGQLRKEFTSAGSFTFPVGDNIGTAEYSPVTLNFTSGSFSSGCAIVNVVNAKHPQNTSTKNYINRYWTINSTGISDFSCDVTLKYTDDDIQAGGIESNIYGGKHNGSFWTLLNPVDPILNQITATVNSFSDFTGGESSALPVELISFNAFVKGNTVKLLWETSTEDNNYGFEIERVSTSPIQGWEKIGFVNGHGNSSSPKKYSFEDSKLLNNSYQYRLKQIDQDGSFSYSNIVSVSINQIPGSFALYQNYPNPFNPTTKISWQSPISGWQTLKIYDILGNEVATLVNEFKEAGFYEANFDASTLSTSVYIYKIQAGNFSETKKMILSK